MKTFDLEAIQRCLAAVMPMFKIGNRIIMLSSVEEIVAEADGRLTFKFLSGTRTTITAKEAEDLERSLHATIAQAVAAAQAAAAKEKFKI